MSQFLYSVGGFIIAISILVVIHELGHYFAARAVGVKVLRFSVGFGRPLWSRRFGADATEWVIAALPFGGYVKMLDEHEAKVARRERARAYNRQSIPRRALIVVAGPLANFLFAIAAYAAIYGIGIEGMKPVVGKVAAGSIAERGGFRSGDTLTAIDGMPVLSWEHRRLYLYRQALAQARLEVEVRDADGVRRMRELDLAPITPAAVSTGLVEREIGLSGYAPRLVPLLGTVDPQGAAARAGLQAGDRITAVDDRPVGEWAEVVERVAASPGQPLTLRYERAGTERGVTIVPASVENQGRTIGRIGVGVQIPEIPPDLLVRVRLNPLAALGEGVHQTWVMSVLTVVILYRMLRLEVSTETISGPISIAQYAGHSARIGFERFVMFLAVVSISLGVLNLLPVPVLDGGHLLYLGGEAIKGGPLSDRTLYWGQQFGLALLLMLMALAFYNDFLRLLQ